MVFPRPRYRFALAILLAALPVWLWVKVDRHPLLKCFCESKEEIDKAGTKKLAFDSYPQWSQGHQGCPTAAALAEYGGAPKDPWGETYHVDCGSSFILVWSSHGAVAISPAQRSESSPPQSIPHCSR